jgi:hypothetical protein
MNAKISFSCEMYVLGILVVEKPCGIVVDVRELFGSEIKTQVYALIHISCLKDQQWKKQEPAMEKTSKNKEIIEC